MADSDDTLYLSYFDSCWTELPVDAFEVQSCVTPPVPHPPGLQDLRDHVLPMPPMGMAWKRMPDRSLRLMLHRDAGEELARTRVRYLTFAQEADTVPDSAYHFAYLARHDDVTVQGFTDCPRESFEQSSPAARALRSFFPVPGFVDAAAPAVEYWRGHVLDFATTLGDAAQDRISTRLRENFVPERFGPWANSIATQRVNALRRVEGAYSRLMLYSPEPPMASGTPVPDGLVFQKFARRPNWRPDGVHSVSYDAASQAELRRKFDSRFLDDRATVDGLRPIVLSHDLMPVVTRALAERNSYAAYQQPRGRWDMAGRVGLRMRAESEAEEATGKLAYLRWALGDATLRARKAEMRYMGTALARHAIYLGDLHGSREAVLPAGAMVELRACLHAHGFDLELPGEALVDVLRQVAGNHADGGERHAAVPARAEYAAAGESDAAAAAGGAAAAADPVILAAGAAADERDEHAEPDGGEDAAAESVAGSEPDTFSEYEYDDADDAAASEPEVASEPPGAESEADAGSEVDAGSEADAGSVRVVAGHEHRDAVPPTAEQEGAAADAADAAAPEEVGAPRARIAAHSDDEGPAAAGAGAPAASAAADGGDDAAAAAGEAEEARAEGAELEGSAAAGHEAIAGDDGARSHAPQQSGKADDAAAAGLVTPRRARAREEDGPAPGAPRPRRVLPRVTHDLVQRGEFDRLRQHLAATFARVGREEEVELDFHVHNLVTVNTHELAHLLNDYLREHERATVRFGWTIRPKRMGAWRADKIFERFDQLRGVFGDRLQLIPPAA